MNVPRDVGGKEYREAEAAKLQIRHPANLKTLFATIVGVLEEAQQVQALEALINLVRSSCGNIEACFGVGLQREILKFLSERGLFVDPCVTVQVLKKILRLLLYLANHSVNIDDIRAMLAVFRSMRLVHEAPDDTAVSYYLSTLEMIARDSFGPASFFDLSGEFSGLILPVLDSFPNNGYTFCAWIKFETLPEVAAPLFTFCGKSGVGIMCSFVKASLMLTCFDKKKNDGHVEVPDLITPGRWHFLTITHTHRQIRGSKLDVYLNAELRQSLKLAYPNTSLMAPVVKSLIGMRESYGSSSLRVLLGPTALFGQALPTNIIANIRSVDEYDALVFQFNSYISSSSTSSGVTVSSGPSNGGPGSSLILGSSSDGLLLAYDARHCDRFKGVCYDSSGNGNHAEAASAGVRLRHASTFKQSVAQLGGPLICLPLLVASRVSTSTGSNGVAAGNLDDSSGVTAQFDEDSEFLQHMSDLIARPLGVKCIPKVLLLIAEIMRHSLVNKFIFRRNQGVRLTALLVRSLPPRYLTSDLLIAIERLRSAVISDRTLSDEIYKFLLFNFRVWVNAPVELQQTVFEKLEIMTRKDESSFSPVSTRHFLRCLSWIYWKESQTTSLRRAKQYTPDEIDVLRKRVLAIIKIVLCEAQAPKLTGATSVIARAAIKGKEQKSQLSYESTRTLIYCMIGKPTNPMLTGVNPDGTPITQENGEHSLAAAFSAVAKSISEGEAEAGSAVENVPEADLPDLLQLLIELSVEPSAPEGLLDLFARLGGLRIWLPLLEFSNDAIRVMTLRLLRTYLFLKCGCTQDREKANSPDKIHLSVGDAYLIMLALKPEEVPVTMGVYSEMLLTILGIQVSESDMKALDGKTEAFDSLIDEETLASATIWHGNMMFPFLSMVRSSPMPIRVVAIRHLMIIFGSATVASTINRHYLIFNSISSMNGTATVSSTTEQIPIIEAILSLRGADSEQTRATTSPRSLFGIELKGCPGIPMSQLRELVLNANEPEEVRVNAMYSIVAHEDMDFLRSLLTLNVDGERKKQANANANALVYKDMSSRIKLALIELMAAMQPSDCVDFITDFSYDLISSIVCLEARSNELAWFLLQDPFTSLSRFISSREQLEVVVVSLLKATLNKMSEILSADLKLRGKADPPSRESTLWKNAESLATVAAAVVLHYDPDTLGKVDPTAIDGSGSDEASSADPSIVFWKCERVIWHEAELVDAILGIWQHFTSTFHADTDASFNRRASNAARYIPPSLQSGGGSGSGGGSPPSSTGARPSSNSRELNNHRNSTGRISFGFGVLSSAGAPAPTTSGSISARPHPGGPMRQVLQLLLRYFHLVLLEDSEALAEEDEHGGEATSSKLRLPTKSVFFARLNKFEYFINAMGLGRDTSQFESSFTPSRGSMSGFAGPGLITASECVKAAPGDETALLLWLVPELAHLIDRVRRKFWSDSAIKLASILASLVPISLRSSDELAALLARSDFLSNNQEVRRRDGFYHEQVAHAREGRALKRTLMQAEETHERNRAKAELERIGRSTRTSSSSSLNASVTFGATDNEELEQQAQVWLQRVKAKDIDDWMKLRVLLKWGIRHVWGGSTGNKDDDLTTAASQLLTGGVALDGLFGQEEFWRLDTYTSSNWIRCRLLPDTDDTHSDFSRYESLNQLKADGETFVDALSIPLVNSVLEEGGASVGGQGLMYQDPAEQAYDDEDEDYGDGEGDVSPNNHALEDGGSSFLDDSGEPYTNGGGGPGSRHNSTTSNQARSASRGDLTDSASSEYELSPPKPLQDLELVMDTNMVREEQEEAPMPVTRTGRRESVATAAEVAMSVKSAKDRMARISNISSRFSSGIMRLKTARPTAKSQDEEALAAEAASSSSGNDNGAAANTPTMSMSVSSVSSTSTGLEKSFSGIINVEDQMEEAASIRNPLGALIEGEPSEDPVSPDGSTDSTSTNNATPSGDAAASTPTANTRVARPLTASRSEQWRTLGASYRTKAYLILPSGVMVYGMLRIGSNTIVFEGEWVCTLKNLSENAGEFGRGGASASLGDAYVSQLKRRVWGVRVIRVIHRRRFLLDAQNGLEVYFVDGSSCLFGFESNGETDLVYATLRERKPPCLVKWGKRILSADRMFGKSKWTEMWVRREISNFEYLMLLNVSAGRSYNDITQYPVFPWILKDYESTELRLEDPTIYRDFRKPIGVQTPESSQRVKDKYDSADPSSKLPSYHFSTSYSHMRSVLFFLVRLAPFTSAAFGTNFVGTDNTPTGQPFGASTNFDSVADAFQKCVSEEGHSFELPPEFFYLPDFLMSDRNKMLAASGDQSSSVGPSGSVVLPNWAISPHDFVRQHRLALESDYVSEHLHHWIDLIFGFKQAGRPSVDSQNVYHVACYPERLNLDTLNVGVRSKLTQRGTVPIQLFRKPHPTRMTQDGALEARFPASHAVATLSSRRQVRRHDLTSKHTESLSSIRFSNAMNHGLGLSGPGLGSGSGIGAHSTGSSELGSVVYTTDSSGIVMAKRYLNSVPDQGRVCPFSFVDVDQWWKLPAGCLVSEGVVFYEQMISCGYWDGSWRIHWSADGELLQRIAFHKKPILCMARSEDDFTGDLALAFGSEDCTVSVWALSKMAATRSRRMFVKKELPVGGLPWVLLCGHTSPVIAVGLNVDLDVVVSSSKDNALLIHSLRSSTPLHSVSLQSPSPSLHSIVTHMTISPLGDALIHAIIDEHTSPSSRSRSSSSHRLSVAEDNFRTTRKSESYEDVRGNGGSDTRQSELFLVSMNGHLISHDKLTGGNDASSSSTPQLLLDRGVLFTRSGEYIITATAIPEAAIEVRDAGMPSNVVRRIECKRTSELTSISLSSDERCILCGYEDGSIVAYALHFGIADGCKNIIGLEKKAREEEAEALARAHKRELLRKEAASRRDEILQIFGSGGPTVQGKLWMKAGKMAMPAEPLVETMQSHFTLLKQPCASGDSAYEELIANLWHAIYSQQPFRREDSRSSIGFAIEEEGSGAATNGMDNALIDTLQFERVGETWSRLGFQRPDPTTDFRAGGMLSLRCLVYFASHYTEQAVKMVTSQVPGSHENTYPWGPAGINITCMLARLFWKFDGQVVRERALNWPLFADSEAFYKVFSEVFVLFDFLWKQMNANYGGFSLVIQATTERVLDVLDEAKGDLQAVLVELRAQSLSQRTSRSRRPSSRSMEDFLSTMNSSISGFGSSSSNDATSRHSFTSTSLLPSSPLLSGDASFMSRLSWSSTLNASSSTSASQAPPAITDLLDFSLSPRAASTSAIPSMSSAAADSQANASTEATRRTSFGAMSSDPFAGNDFRGQDWAQPAAAMEDVNQSEDPFACLM
ncbi:Kinase a-anchor protein [Globisporangium polare]